VYLSVDQLSIFLSNHRKDIQKLFDPTKDKCCKFVQQGWKNSILTFSRFKFPSDFQTTETYETYAPAI